MTLFWGSFTNIIRESKGHVFARDRTASILFGLGSIFKITEFKSGNGVQF
jgi:hypothetical protein